MRMPAPARLPVDPHRRGRQLPSRLAAGLLGGYLFSWGVVAFGAASLFKLGMDFHDAEFIAHSVGVLGYLCLFLWAFAGHMRVWRLWALLLVGGSVLAGLASLVQSSIGGHL